MDSEQSEVQVTLRNGEIVRVNDHVYCSPSWAIRDGTPYSVARIMQFLPPENKTTAGSLDAQGGTPPTRKGKGRESWARVRLAWYYRPSDVSDRNVADSRLLLAAIYSEVCDINQLRAKCYVLHRDKITSLADWKRRPDHFYFHRLFDPYIKREFEVLLSSEVRNLPQHIRDILILRYEYVVTEKEVVPDLTDQLRLCETCGEWCAHNDAVQCASCKNHFHMSCVNPPLLAKPSRGYGWSCAPCSRKHEDRVDAGEKQQGREGTPKGFGPKGFKSRGRPRKANSGTATPLDVDNNQIKHFRMWPFRYFGLYTVAEDTLDPDDLIFPRAATRVGYKYQVTVPLTKDEPIPRSSGSVSVVSDRSGEDSEILPRGGSDTVETLGMVHCFDEAEVSILDGKMMSEMQVKPDNLWKMDWLTEVVRMASQLWEQKKSLAELNTKLHFRTRKWSTQRDRYTDREWSHEEKFMFDQGIEKYGAELRSVRELVETRPMPDIVRYYGLWKNERLKEENKRIRKAQAKGDKSTLVSQKRDEDDNNSVVDIPPSAPGVRHSNFCAACRTRDSNAWWKAPKGLATAILCDTCGLNWRKYADLNARPTTREDSAAIAAGTNGVAKGRGGDKREGTPLSAPAAKKPKVDVLELKAAKAQKVAVAHQEECLCCFSKGEKYDIVRCGKCDLSIHAGLGGVDVDALREGRLKQWICELCDNEKTQENSLSSKCVVCNPSNDTTTMTFMRAVKPTEGQGWIHVICSIYHPECHYSDAMRLRIVEGISLIPKNRWTSTCQICRKPGGAVVRCSNCPKEFHVSCAWPHGNRFGFEIQPVKTTRRDMVQLVTFKGKCGFMAPVILCPEHTSYRSTVYDLCDTNEAGETALQVYARTYRQAPVDNSHSLLRKAERLDQLMGDIRLDRGSSLPTSSSVMDDARSSSITGGLGEDDDTQCARCKTWISPMFHPDPSSKSSEDAGRQVCHACFFKVKKEQMDKEEPMPMVGVEAAQVNGEKRPEVADVVMATA